MPESKGRAKPAYTPPPQRHSKTTKPNPPWLVPVMLWVVTFYVTETKYPIPGIEYKNLIIGFGLMISGFLMTTRWR